MYVSIKLQLWFFLTWVGVIKTVFLILRESERLWPPVMCVFCIAKKLLHIMYGDIMNKCILKRRNSLVSAQICSTHLFQHYHHHISVAVLLNTAYQQTLNNGISHSIAHSRWDISFYLASQLSRLCCLYSEFLSPYVLMPSLKPCMMFTTVLSRPASN